MLHSTATFELVPPREVEMLERWTRIHSLGVPYLVAAVGDDIAGYAYAAPYRVRPAYRNTLEDTIYLHPDFTGRGFGAKLLGELIAQCQSLGYKQLIAIIGGNDPQSPSRRLHAKLGFREAGLLRSVGYKFDQWLDTALMQRSLDPDV